MKQFNPGSVPNTDKQKLESTTSNLQKDIKAVPKNFNATDKVTIKESNPDAQGTGKNPMNEAEDKKELSGKSTNASSSIWIKKWVDYSSKYGLGYMLTNGSTGVFFNDSSKIILDAKG
jgi:polo-like kinase 1